MLEVLSTLHVINGGVKLVLTLRHTATATKHRKIQYVLLDVHANNRCKQTFKNNHQLRFTGLNLRSIIEIVNQPKQRMRQTSNDRKSHSKVYPFHLRSLLDVVISAFQNVLQPPKLLSQSDF